MDYEELRQRFIYHAPDEEKAKTHLAIRGNCYSAAEYFNKVLPECQEKSLAIRKLEEAAMWANAALARHG